MRPIMRLPLREALYVCSNCRSEALPRTSSLARQFRRYASNESSGFLDRTRRQLWSEKPPGAEDPYTGESQMNRQAETEGGERQAGGLQAGSGEGSDLQTGDNYTQADTWDGLDVIGFAREDEWLERGSVPAADEYSRYDADVTPRSVSLASHQAAVELALMQLLGKPLASVCEVSSHNEQVQQMIDGCSFVASNSSVPALRFADQQSMEALVFIFNQIGGKTEVQVESPEKLILQEQENADGLRNSISLADPAVKFAFAKRFSQLLGRRIPDQIISDANTVGDLAAGLNTPLKEKPINVTKSLARDEKAGTLPPNLRFSSKRLTKADHDEDVGRKKAIVSELYRRGLIVPKDRKKPAAFH